MKNTVSQEKKELYYSAGLVFGPLVLLVTLLIFLNPKEIQKEEPVVARTVSTETEIHAPQTNPFDDVSVIAQSAFVKDIRTGEVYFSKNHTEARPLASITKTMTALIANEILDDSDSVTITFENLLTDGESFLQPGESLNSKSLSDFTLISSSNDGAAALAQTAGARLFNRQGGGSNGVIGTFIDAMNARAQALGLTKTVFYNETGLDDPITNEAGAYGSAEDVASLFSYILKEHPDVLEATNETSIRTVSDFGLIHQADNTNVLTASIPSLLASKTGYTEQAGGNLAIVFDASLNQPIVVVVLGSTYQGRFSDVEALVDATREYIKFK